MGFKAIAFTTLPPPRPRFVPPFPCSRDCGCGCPPVFCAQFMLSWSYLFTQCSCPALSYMPSMFGLSGSEIVRPLSTEPPRAAGWAPCPAPLLCCLWNICWRCCCKASICCCICACSSGDSAMSPAAKRACIWRSMASISAPPGACRCLSPMLRAGGKFPVPLSVTPGALLFVPSGF